jgi:hypothetical protein
MLVTKQRTPDTPYKVFLLSKPDDERTYKLPHPIEHLEPRRGSAFVMKQWYTSRAALERHPKTTDEFRKYEQE